jgi:act minimal PKS chain-length factor (CLF/KS beta)
MTKTDTAVRPKAVITGIAVAAPNGLDVAEFWAATRAGRAAIGPATRFGADGHRTRWAGEIKDFTARDHLPSRLVPQTDRMTQLALVTADRALADAGVRPGDVPAHRTGVVTAAGAGGFTFGERELDNLWSRGGKHVSAYQSFACFQAVGSGQLSVRHGTRGPSSVLVADQAGGLDALAHARRQIRKGCGMVLAGGFDAMLSPLGWAAHSSTGWLSTADRADRAYRPFDAEAHGYVPGEGGALVVVESEESARARGAGTVHAEIAGHGATLDPRPGSGREPGLRRAVELALADAGCAPADVDVAFADASGVPDLDRAEAQVLKDVFGPYAVPVTAPKTMIGRLCSGGALVDVVTVALAMREGLIPPAVHVTPDSRYALDLVVGRPRTASVHTALVMARGRGGFNSAMVLRSAG